MRSNATMVNMYESIINSHITNYDDTHKFNIFGLGVLREVQNIRDTYSMVSMVGRQR